MEEINYEIYKDTDFKTLKALDFNINKIKEEKLAISTDNKIDTEFIIKFFKTCGGFVSNKDVKSLLNIEYEKLGVKKKFPATKILELLGDKVKKSKKTINNKRIYGYRLS